MGGPTKVVPAVPGQTYFYERDKFGGKFHGLFDAEINTKQRIVTLIVSLDFTVLGWGNTPADHVSAVAQKFMKDMKDVVETTWSKQYGILWAYQAFPDRYKAMVDVVLDGRFRFNRPCAPHVQIGIHPHTPGERSCAGGGGGGLQENDNSTKEHTRTLFLNANTKQTKEYTFFQVTTAHEFGHMIGLDHIAGKGNDTQNYGMTPDLARDIMGSGSVVSKRDYEPFLAIMKRFGEDHLTPELNKWNLVDAE